MEQDFLSFFPILFAPELYHTVICMASDGTLGSDCGEGVPLSVCSEARVEGFLHWLGSNCSGHIVSVPLIDCVFPSGRSLPGIHGIKDPVGG